MGLCQKNGKIQFANISSWDAESIPTISFELKRLSGHKIGQSYFLHAPEMEVAVLGSVVLGSVVLVT